MMLTPPAGLSIWPPLNDSKARAMVTSLALALASDYDKTNAEFCSLFQKTFRMKQGLNIKCDSASIQWEHVS